MRCVDKGRNRRDVTVMREATCKKAAAFFSSFFSHRKKVATRAVFLLARQSTKPLRTPESCQSSQVQSLSLSHGHLEAMISLTTAHVKDIN